MMIRFTKYILPLTLVAVCTESLAATLNPFVEIRTTVRGAEECLAAGADQSVSLHACEGTDEQQWILDDSSGNWSFVRNKAVNQTKPGMCLYAMTTGVKMNACAGTGYTSFRMWKKSGDNGSFVLSNKFIGDTGRPNYLQPGEEGRLVFGEKDAVAAKWGIGQPPSYSEIIHVTKDGEKCLTLATTTAAVSAQTCTGSDRQMWAFRGASPWWYIKNKALAQTGERLCLYAEPNSLSMRTCAGSGSDYTSHRLWKMADLQDHDALQNKYIGDLSGHSKNYLQLGAGDRLLFGGSQADEASWQVAARYGYIRNVEQGQMSCLALSANGINVGFEPCRSDARQDWSVVFAGAIDGYHLLTNRALAASGAPKCLGNEARMINCRGSGYTSMRSWYFRKNRSQEAGVAVGGILIKNKFLDDLGDDRVLAVEHGVVKLLSATHSARANWDYQWPVPLISMRPVIGNKKALLLHAQWSNYPATNFQDVRRAVFGEGANRNSLAEAVRISSDDKVTLTGDAVTGLNLGPRPKDCSGYVAFRTKAIELAKAKGYDASRYDYLFVEVPSISSCSWAAIAEKPGKSIFAQGSGHKYWMWQHEFGHNIGAPHATSLQHCPRFQGSVQVGASGCQVTTASDPSDTMNGGGARLYPLPYMYFAGWLNDVQVPEVSNNGVYTLAPLFGGVAVSIAKGLRIPREDGSYLTMEFRQPRKDVFEGWTVGDPFVQGVIVRIANFSPLQVSNQLVDATPDSAAGMSDAPLMPGQSMDDALSGKRITVLSANSAGAAVRISDMTN